MEIDVDRIAELGKEASDFEIETFSPPAGAVGLPSAIDFGFDHRECGGVKDLAELAEKWRLHPARRKGTAAITTLQSFISLVNRHKTEHSVIFAETTWPNPSLTAVVDYHEKENGKPQFNQHRVHYAFPLTDEFKEWAGRDGKAMTQHDFAAFIEDRVAELADPTEEERQEFEPLFNTRFATPADMLTLSRGLEVNVAAQVKNAVTLQSGEGQIVFVEEHKDGKGDKIIVPGLFMISVPAFLAGEPVRLPARLRYRAANGSLSWFYQLYRWKNFLRDRVVSDLSWAESETELPAYEGKPEV